MLRRPLYYSAVFLVLSVIVFDNFGIYGASALAVFLFAFAKSCRCTTVKRIAIICVIFFVIGVVNCTIHEIYSSQLILNEGEERGLICDVLTVKAHESEEGRNRQTVTAKVMESGFNEKVIVNFYGDNVVSPGDTVRISGEIEIPQEKRNPGCFDYRKYLRSKDIYVTVKAKKLEILKEGSGLRSLLYDFKCNFSNELTKNTGGETAAMVEGILFGDKTDINEDILSDFQKNGTAHILAVSGLHVGMLYGFVGWMWPLRKRKLYFIFVGGILLCYSVLSDMSPSVVRASFMVLIHILSSIHGRKYDLCSAAFTVVIIFVMLNPFCIYDTSFQMSFIAVLAMSMIMPYVKRIHEGIITGSIAVQMGLMPYIGYTFNFFSPAAFLVNVPVIALTGIIVPSGLVAFTMTAAGINVPTLLFTFFDMSANLLTRINSTTCIDGLTTFDCKSMSGFTLSLIYLAMLVLFSENGRLLIMRYGRNGLAISIAIIIAASFTFWGLTRTGFEHTDVVFVDVGQGDCVHVRTNDGRNYLFDGGGKEDYNIGAKVLRPYLLKNGVRHVDGAIVSHLHTDHYKGISELCREGIVRELFIYEANRVNEETIIKETGLTQNHIHYLCAGMTMNLGKNASAEVVWPKRRSAREYVDIVNDEKKENEISLVMKVKVDGMTLLTTGDIDENCESELIKEHARDIDVDILKVAHHGSKYSSSPKFLEALSPELAVIQVGRNTYGHPTPEAMSRLADAGSVVYRNDESGAVGIEIDDGKIKNIRTVIK